MRALVLEKFGGPFVPKDVPTPAIAPHEALVRVRNVGVCGTDVKIRADRMGLGVIPLIMGQRSRARWPRSVARCATSRRATGSW